MQPGYYRNISNEDYHAGPGVSKSQLDLVRHAPALLEWSRNAPRDEEATAGVDIGDAFHAMLLEPHRFEAEYIVAPEVDRRTKAGKDEWADFKDAAGNRKVLTYEEGRKLWLMRESALAHPVARRLVEDDGDVEPSIYWRDPATGLLCRCRPDKLVSARRIMLDVKTTADMERFDRSIADYRYHVQDAFYSEGYARHFGEESRGFVFLAVSTSLSAGRYQVRCFSLIPSEREIGRAEFRQDLETVMHCTDTGIWPGIEPISRPAWARARAA